MQRPPHHHGKKHQPEKPRSYSLSEASRAPTIADNIVYGKNPIREILRTGSRKIKTLFVTKDSERALNSGELAGAIKLRRIPLSVVDAVRLNRLAPGVVHQNIVAETEAYRYANFSELLENFSSNELVLLLDCVQDPQNFGTLCRSALAFGVSAIVLPRDRSVAVTASVCKASSGAVEHLKIVQVTNLARCMEDLKKDGFWIYGTSLRDNPTPLNRVDPAKKSALVLGSEGDGLRPLVAHTCDMLIKIPMAADFDSLNVAQAGTVCLYEFAARMGILDSKD